MKNNSLTCIILAAGKGKRMKSSLPKVMHKIAGLPMITYPIMIALKLKIHQIVVVLGFGHQKVKEYIISRFPGTRFEICIQNPQLGTAHAVMTALTHLSKIERPLLILQGDTPLLDVSSITALVQRFFETKAVLGLITFEAEDPKGYGRVIRLKDKVIKVQEDRDCSSEQREIKEVNAGVYLIESKFLLENINLIDNKNIQQEFYLPDLVEKAAQKGDVIAVKGERESFLGVNTRRELAEVEGLMRKRINLCHMNKGITLIDPQRTYIEFDVVIGKDTEIGPATYIGGKTQIGQRCKIEGQVTIFDSIIEDEVEVRNFCVITGARIRSGTVVGPFTHLRPETVLETGVKVGNFVEVKKSVIGKGSKANHLSYIGDATLGERVNIGAGTITCNYDGFKKHPTIIEDEVFVGSDTQFVAPVRIGKQAFIGAGSTITKDVPSQALALTRPPQKVIPQYFQRRKKKLEGG
jgi:bifunctional UDP-N-acetylglucosamine pyrophosphorylase/glucosamine-1-phosphate N-acetyltransferase